MRKLLILPDHETPMKVVTVDGLELGDLSIRYDSATRTLTFKLDPVLDTVLDLGPRE